MVTMWGPPTGVSAVMTVTMAPVMFLNNECLHSSIFLYYDLLYSFTGGYKCKCGLEKATRIVGGTEVKPVSVSSIVMSASYHHSAQNKYPWMVGLLKQWGLELFCGGTLVASKYVVTAAHCVHNLTDNQGNGYDGPLKPSDLKVTCYLTIKTITTISAIN